MAYYIDIINTKSDIDQLVLKAASASGITLKWNGGDAKDDLSIVSSELAFDMLSETAEDAAFVSLFTGDEHQFKVLVKDSETDIIYWQGYILPDLYSEPYQNGCFFVQFTAVDCLGRLKGKYLPDDFYYDEKSLIEIYSECLKLTGLTLDMAFSPAIENFVQKDWNEIYIDTETFLDGEKKTDAYSILETLLKDTLCVCYQADNRWYIEGLNKRHVREIQYKIYDSNGVYKIDENYLKIIKSITPAPTPLVTQVPPYKDVTVNETKVAPKIPETAVKEKNDGWAIVTGVKGLIQATSWISNPTVSGTSLSYEEGLANIPCVEPDYNVRLIPYGTSALNYYISLREKIYYAQNDKVKITLGFKLVYDQVPSDLNLWKNPFKYEIVFADEVIFSNSGGNVEDREQLIFDESGNAKIEIEHIFSVSEGLLDIRLYRYCGDTSLNFIKAVEITDCDVQIIGFNENVTETDLINGEFTINKTVDLTYTDDKSGYNKGFRLDKLKVESDEKNIYTIDILYQFELQGKYYAVVSLEDANIIKENIRNVFYTEIDPGPPATVIPYSVVVNAVYYNFNNGEQMVLELFGPLDTDQLKVSKFAINDVLVSRDSWMQWTDSVYKIENTRYAKTVANIYRRMFNEAHEKIDFMVLNAIKFNDIISFKYVFEKQFYILNCSWNMDQDKSVITVGRSHYKDSSGTGPEGNIPPIVVANEDIFMLEHWNSVSLSATAYDPDGVIFSVKWEKLVGDFGDIIDSPDQLNTYVFNLTGDYYEYKITVTDNNGATASDIVKLIRQKDYSVSLDEISFDDNIGSYTANATGLYRLNFTPDLLIDTILNINGIVELQVDGQANEYTARCVIKKNGIILETTELHINYIPGMPLIHQLNKNIVLSVINTDIIEFELYNDYLVPTTSTGANTKSSVKINTIDVVSGSAIFTGLPLIKEQNLNYL